MRCGGDGDGLQGVLRAGGEVLLVHMHYRQDRMRAVCADLLLAQRVEHKVQGKKVEQAPQHVMWQAPASPQHPS